MNLQLHLPGYRPSLILCCAPVHPSILQTDGREVDGTGLPHSVFDARGGEGLAVLLPGDVGVGQPEALTQQRGRVVDLGFLPVRAILNGWRSCAAI